MLEISGKIRPVVFPGFCYFRVFFTPFLIKTVKVQENFLLLKPNFMHIIVHRMVSKYIPEGGRNISSSIPFYRIDMNLFLSWSNVAENTQTQSIVMISATPLNSSTNEDEQQMPPICSLFMNIVTAWKHLRLLLLIFMYLIPMFMESLIAM